MTIINDTVYFEINPLQLIFISIAIYIIIITLERFFTASTEASLVHLKLRIHDKEFDCVGKIDTGCSVVEPFSGSPVIIIESSILDQNIQNKCTRIVPYKALGCDGILYAIKADEISIDKKVINQNIYIGIYKGEIDKTIKAIINSQIIR